MRKWSDKTEVTQGNILGWIGMYSSTFAKWQRCSGKAFEHNGWIPRDHWLTPEERQAILKFHFEHPLNGYRRLTYMMLDANVVACSPTTVHRVLSQAGVLKRHNTKPSLKGTGFQQRLKPHEHWHVDVAYINIRGTFYFLASVLDGYSRLIVHWDIREKMEEVDIEVILQRAREKFPEAKPRIISDNGPQFIANDFKSFIRLCGMTHVRTSPFYPQSNGKLERFHRTIKSECIRPQTPLCLEDGLRITEKFIQEYNDVRLHSAIGYVTPRDMLEGRQKAIHAQRDRKLAEARERRAALRESKNNSTLSSAEVAGYTSLGRPEDKALPGGNLSAGSTPRTCSPNAADAALGETPVMFLA